jgi:hypothetical protein
LHRHAPDLQPAAHSAATCASSPGVASTAPSRSFEDNLAALRILEHEAQVQDKTVTAAQKYLELSIMRYKGGVTSYLEVTTAQTADLSDELTAVNIFGPRIIDAVTRPSARWRLE